MVAPRSAGGVSMRMGSPVHTMRQTSAIMKDRPEGDQHLGQLGAGQAAQDEPLDDAAEDGHQQPGHQRRRPEVEARCAIRLVAR